MVLVTNPKHSTKQSTTKKMNSILARLSTKKRFIKRFLNCHLTLGFMDHVCIKEQNQTVTEFHLKQY